MRIWESERVLVIGAARQGIALAAYLLEQGSRVVINDQRAVEDLVPAQEALKDWKESGRLDWVCGGHPIEALDGITLVCPSGGVPLTLPLVVEAQKRGIPLSNDSQIFLETAPCKVIGITGSAGKTTTTTLVGRMAQAAVDDSNAVSGYRRAWVGGNIGSPLISAVHQMEPDDLAVMELSSFQLEIMTRSPHIAAILNITPNHLDRHGTMEAYSAAKAQILAHQTKNDAAILGRDDPGSWRLAKKTKGKMYSFGLSDLPPDHAGAFFKNGTIFLRGIGLQTGLKPASFHKNAEDAVDVISKQAIGLRGEHNLLNVMAACSIAAAAGLAVSAMRAGISNFRGVPHRLEFVRRWGGADWYNDSIATAPERAIAAIQSFREPLVLLAGGRDKNLPWDHFCEFVRQRVDHLILFGEAGELIYRALGLRGDEKFTVVRCGGLKEAVQQAAALVKPGDVVLLSPGGTSFDEFRDFEERGECFARWVKELP